MEGSIAEGRYPGRTGFGDKATNAESYKKQRSWLRDLLICFSGLEKSTSYLTGLL